jgi:hypothetical protein
VKKLKLPRIKVSIDIDDLLIIAGTACFTYGLWGYDPRAALMTLGAWLVLLGRLQPKRGDD